jgi:hypothetical protein
MEQRDDTEPGPDSHNADPAAEQPEDRTLSVKKKKKKGRAKLSNDDWSLPVSQPGIEESKSLPAERPSQRMQKCTALQQSTVSDL